MEYFLRIEKQAISMAGDNAQLVFCIPSFDVEGRIGLCKSLFPCIRDSSIIICSLVVHQRQDIIGSPVEDAAKRIEKLIVVILLEVADNGYAGPCGCLIKKRYFIFLLEADKLTEMVCHHNLVGGNHILPAFHRRRDNAEGLIGIIDKLYDKVYRRVVKDVVFVEGEVRHRYTSLLSAVFHADPYDICSEALAAVQHVVKPLSHAAIAEHSYSEFMSCHCKFILKFLSRKIL